MNSDNKFGKCCKCPSQMSDGRLYTNYLLNSKLNSYVKKVNNITDEHDYRNFLQKNASTIMKNEQTYLNNNKRCDFTLLN